MQRSRTQTTSGALDGAYALGQLLQIISARREIVVYCLAACLTASVVYVVLAPPRYLASASVLVDTPKMKLLRQDTVLTDQPTDEFLVESQIQMLRSDDVARKVVAKLDLVNSSVKSDDAAFPFGKIRAMLRSLPIKWGNQPATKDGVEQVVDTLKNNVRVRRVGLSRVLEVTYNSVDPRRAADVANAFIEAYIQDKRDTQENATQRSIAWLKEQLEAVKQQLTDAERALEAYKSTGKAASAGEYRTRLKELESYAQSYRSLHDSLLPRYAEVVQQQGLPTSEARPIDRAQVPAGKSQPRTGLVLAFGTVLGLTLGIGLALARDFLAGIRSPADIETLIGIRAWGALPRTEAEETLASAIPEKRIAARLSGPASLVLDQPMAPHAETIRAVINAMDSQSGPAAQHIIGVTSTLKGEGRVTVCLNLAYMMAAAGSSVLVIDADRQSKNLSMRLTPEAKSGVVDVLAGAKTIDETIWKDPVTGLDILPLADEWIDIQDPRHALASGSLLPKRLRSYLTSEITGHYDRIVVCLPALEGSADASPLVEAMDSLILVVEWQTTPSSLILNALERTEHIEAKLTGAILNKVEPTYLDRISQVATVRSLATDAYDSFVRRPLGYVAPALTSLRARPLFFKPARGNVAPVEVAKPPLADIEPIRETVEQQTETVEAGPTAPADKLTPRRFASSVVGGMLKSTGVLSFNISRVQSERLLTSVYFHHPRAQNFEQTIRWLLGRGYAPVSTAEVEKSLRGEIDLPPLALHVSLDDAWRSNLKDVVPIATALDLPITIFVPTEPIVTGHYWWTKVERIAKDDGRTVANLKRLPDEERRSILERFGTNEDAERDAMTLDELKAVARLSNVTIGSHTVSHPILTKCSDEDVMRELVDSKATLEKWLDKEVTSFAYPNGSFGKREVEAVRKAGYQSAFTVHQRHAALSGENPLTLPRFALTNDGPVDADLCRAVGVWPSSPI